MLNLKTTFFNYMKKILLILLVASLSISAAKAQANQTVTKSAVNFEIKNLGIKVTGTLGGFRAEINFDPATATGKIEASVETKTINTNSEMRDNHLRKDDYFDVEKYPKIIMKSSSFKHKGGENYTGQFDVTIKDKTKSVEVPFKYIENGKTATYSGKFKINRRDFGVGGNSLILSDEVTVMLDIETTRE